MSAPAASWSAASLQVHEATPAELADWDAHTVDVPGGQVLQSRTWGEYRSRHGWRSRYLVLGDGFRILVAERPWPLVGGATAYVPRGPVQAGEAVERTADRLRAVADWLAAHGVDAVSSDAEVPADTGYRVALSARGFRPVEEVQPSRHRVSLPLAPGVDAATVFDGFTKSLRQTIRTAANRGVAVVRYDALAASSRTDDGSAIGGPDVSDPASLGMTLTRMHDLLEAAAERRDFALAPLVPFVDVTTHAIAAGLALLLEARAPDGDLLASSLFHRHGQRITYALSGDVVEHRRDFPGVVQLLLWHAIQLAIAERCVEFDLAGVDIRGARHRPAAGDRMHGLLEMKERFGGRWLELSGNHEWVARPGHRTLGRIARRAARSLGRPG
jgi:lipid II:glycine glycyltransferase (peptidoglycan interpeptide bridge formation enzyme)